MAENIETMNVVQKLARVRKISDAVVKDKRGHGYTYAEITQILAKVTAGMEKYRVSLIPCVKPGTLSVEQTVSVNTKTDSSGTPFEKTTTEYLVRGEMLFKWVNDDDPSDFIEVPWVVIGAQYDPSQAFGSGLTYCTRYFLTNYFQIGQDNDVDAYRTKRKEAEQAEDLAIAAGLVEEIDAAVKAVLSADAGKRDEIVAFLEKYIKGGNYKKIKDPALAGRLLQDLKKTYSGGTKE